ncbi:MAG: rod shape-determining protein RodA [bacterium]
MFLKKSLNYLKKFDWITFAIVIFFISLGLMAIYGISLAGGEQGLASFKKQILFASVGIIIIFAASFIDYKALKTYGPFLYILSLVLLIAVLFTGRIIRGTKGWFVIYGFGFQPVELAKVFLILSLAKYFSAKNYELKKFSHIIVSGAIALLAIIPTMIQPDLGSAAVLFLIWGGMLLMFGIKKLHFFIIVFFAISIMIISWTFLKPYQKDRIYTFLDPGRDPLGRGYNITQSIIAIGSGQINGKGLGAGTQTQLKFLPETKTDFIFSVIAEELGFWVICLIFFGWAIIFYRICKLAKNASNEFAGFICAGIAIFFFIHLFVNIGVSAGILPATGIPLPFMSYGGSFLTICLISLGIIESIAVRTEKAYFKNEG